MDLPSYLKPINQILHSPQSEVSTSDTNSRIRFMLVSTHAQQCTGYSKISYGILQELSKIPRLDLIHYGFQKHPQLANDFRPYPPSVDVIDAQSLESPPQQGFGYQNFIETVNKKNPQIIMLYNDMAVVSRFLEEIRKVSLPRPFKVWIYCDQVYEGLHMGAIDILNRDADRIFTFTSLWKKHLKEQGVTRPISVLGHGFDPKVFFTVPKDLARKTLKLPDDAFVIMSLNRNQPRKRYDIMLMAFVELLKRNPSKAIVLLCICDKGDKGGWWLFELYVKELKHHGLPIEQFGNRLMISSQDMAFKDEDINILYNVADIGISTADGEGWGLCTFEQMGVGIPQIVPDLGGYKEYCSKQNSMMVTPKHRYYLPSVYSQVGGEAHVCEPHDVCLAIESYLNDSQTRLTHGKAAKETVLSYTWSKAVKDLVRCIQDERDDTVPQ